MNETIDSPGFFGKIPTQTDFACRRLPSAFTRPWENWLQASLRISQRLMGENWSSTYFCGPIWRFVLQTGVCGTDAWAGVLMPSVDKEGLFFPLTLASPIKAVQAQKKLFDRAERWFAHMERFALWALADDFDLSHLDDLLQDLPPFKAGGGGFSLPGRLFQRRRGGISLWQTRGYNPASPENREFQGLPTPQEFVGLLAPHAAPEELAPAAPPALASNECADSDRTEALCHQSAEPSKQNQAPVHWHSWALTDVGMRRKINEDAFLNKPEAGLWVVADGMGGHSAGDVASRTVARRLDQSSAGDSLTVLEQHTRATLQATNTELLELAAQMGPGHVVGTTVVALLAAGDDCAALWAGDSRLYRHRDGTLKQLTIDHSMAVEMAKAHDALPNGYGDNIVTRALGADPVLELDRIAFKARPGDQFLLCSDGLTKEIDPSEMEAIFNAEKGQKVLRRMVDLTLERQARDNVTAILVSAEPA